MIKKISAIAIVFIFLTSGSAAASTLILKSNISTKSVDSTNQASINDLEINIYGTLRASMWLKDKPGDQWWVDIFNPTKETMKFDGIITIKNPITGEDLCPPDKFCPTPWSDWIELGERGQFGSFQILGGKSEMRGYGLVTITVKVWGVQENEGQETERSVSGLIVYNRIILFNLNYSILLSSILPSNS